MVKKLEKVLKALGDKNRLRILKMLGAGPRCVCEIREVLGLAQPSVSKHLRILKEAGLIDDEQDGLWTNYFLSANNPYARALLKELRSWLNSDEIIKHDIKMVGRTDRKSLCRKR